MEICVLKKHLKSSLSELNKKKWDFEAEYIQNKG